MRDIVDRLRDVSEFIRFERGGDRVAAAASLPAEAADAIEKLRRLDVEYGRVEAAIIMADPEFDGDSDHANCGDRLIASVNRLAARRRNEV